MAGKANRFRGMVAFKAAVLMVSASVVVPSVVCQQRSTVVPAQPVQPKFTEITSALGVRFQYRASHTFRKYLIETMGSGVALFDYDNDGRLDIFAVNGALLNDPTPRGSIPQKAGPEYWNRLFHQKPEGTFEDVTEKAGLQGIGYGMGVAVGDYDNDGYEDLYVTAYGGNRLYHNNGNGTFTDVTDRASVGGGGWSTGAACLAKRVDRGVPLLKASTRNANQRPSRSGFWGHRGLRSLCFQKAMRLVSSLRIIGRE